MAASAEGTSEGSSLQPNDIQSGVTEDQGAEGRPAVACTTQASDDNGGTKEGDGSTSTRELDEAPLDAPATEHIPADEEPKDDELEVLLCLLEQRLSVPVGPPSNEQNQQLWETLRSLVPTYRDRVRLLKQRITELELRLEKGQREYLQWRETLLDEHRQRLRTVEEDYERQHRLDLERASNARQQAEGLLLQLADAQAEIKHLESKMQSRIRQLKSEHLKDMQTLIEEKEMQLNTKKSLFEEATTLSKNLQQQYQAEQAKHDAERSCLQQEKAELESRLKGLEALNEDLMSVLEKERGLNQELTSSMGQQEKQIAFLEHEVYKLRSEEQHRNALLEVLSSKVSRDIAMEAEAADKHATLPQLVSQGTSPAASSSHKTDSGVHGMSSSGRSHEEVSVCSVASQVSPQELPDLDQVLKNVTAKVDEKKAAVIQAKQLLRSTTNELYKLTKLAEERAEQLRRLQHRMQSSSTRASTPIGYEHKAGEDIHDIRTSSYGFVPLPSAPSAKAVRKVCYKKPTPTSKESLSTLANMSSIQNNCENSGGLPHFDFHSEDMSYVSDNVFESSRLREKHSTVKYASSKAAHSESQHLANIPMAGGTEYSQYPVKDCFECERELKEKSHLPQTVLKPSFDHHDRRSDRTFTFGYEQPVSLLDGPIKDTTPARNSSEMNGSRKQVRLGNGATEERTPVQKTISRSPWERNQCCGKHGRSHNVHSTPSYDFPLLGKNKIWSYAPCDCGNPPTRPESDSPWPNAVREEKKGARRSLTFPDEATLPAAPFVCCTGTNSETSLGAPREHSFRTAPFSTPVNVTVHVQAYPEPKDLRR